MFLRHWVSQPYGKGIDGYMGPFEKDKFGNKYIVAMTDHFSRFTVLFPTHNATVMEAAREVMHWTGLFGKSAYVLSDMGTQFVNRNIDALLLALKTHKKDILVGVHKMVFKNAMTKSLTGT